MKLKGQYTKGSKQITRFTKLVAALSIVFSMAIPCNLTSYAFERPNNKREIEPNNTQETATLTSPTYESAERFAANDWSGRYSMEGKATSTDDDWYKVSLAAGEQYLSVIHSYGDNATYVEMLDSENNVIIPMKYGTKRNVTRFQSKGGIYYIHIVGASEKENLYTLFVGTPMLSSDEVYVSFNPVKTSGTVRKSFTLADEAILPRDALVAKITLRDLPVRYTSARVKSSSSPTSITFKRTSLSGNIGSLKMELKSRWDIIYYPKRTVTSVPIVDFFYFYPVYDNTEYPHLPNIRK